MNANGFVLVTIGIWVVFQIFGGNALARLKVVPS